MSEPVNNAKPDKIECGWNYYDGEYWHGPFETREIALMEGRKYFYEDGDEPIAAIDLMEGYRPSLRASDFVGKKDINELLGSINEAASDEHGCEDGISFDCTNEQKEELLGLVKKTVDEWQSKNSIAAYSRIIKAITEETVPPSHAIEKEIGDALRWYYLDETTGLYRGSYKNHETALEKAREYYQDKSKPIHLVECYSPSTQISNCLCEHNIDDLIEAAEEEATNVYSSDIGDFGGGEEISFGCSEEQKADLLAFVRQAFDEWQVRNAIAVKANNLKTKRGETVFPDGTVVENEVCNTIAGSLAVDVEAEND